MNTADVPLTRFADFRPTSLDASGRGSEGQADWLLAPVSLTPAIATVLQQSNWECQLAALEAVDPEGEDYELHSFGHWATDFEIVVVRPGTRAHRVAQELTCGLADYPIIDDDHFSAAEHEQQYADLSSELRSFTVIGDGGTDIADSGDLIHTLWSHMWNGGNPWRCLQGDTCVDKADIERALRELGYTYDESEWEWRKV